MKPYRIIISGGGTGGHIFPAISIADECRRRWPDCEILFVGARDRMEMEKVPAAGYQIKGLWISGLQRSLSARNLMFPLKVVKSLLDAGKILNEFQPNVAIGTGGYASGPLLFMAHRKSIPTLIQEQNSYPGITNKLLGSKVDRICVASDGMEKFFPKEKLVLTGNPIRQDLVDLAQDDSQSTIGEFKFKNSDKKTLLVLGGSLGSKRINELIEDYLPQLQIATNIIWQTGKLYHDQYSHHNSEQVRVSAFLPQMNKAYNAADFIISRAGAGTISELAVVGKPVIFIPSPHVAEDHQTKNALHIEGLDAALLIREKDLDHQFLKTWDRLIESKELQDSLSKNIRNLSKPHATTAIVDHIKELIHA